MNTPYTPTFILENWSLPGYSLFSFFFALEHRLWVLVRTASLRLLTYPQSMFWAKIRKKSHFFHLKITILTAAKYCSILHGHVCVMAWRITQNAMRWTYENEARLIIRKTCPYNEHPPFTPLLYRKTGVYRGIHFFLFLL